MKTLVLGASLNEEWYSNRAIRMLVDFEHEVVAQGSNEGTVADIEIATERLFYGDVDTIALYLNVRKQVDFYDYILSLKPRRVIFNPGTENNELYDILAQNNINYEEACTLILLGTDQF